MSSHKSCAYCFDVSEYYCERCFVSYCCRKCQVKDWQIHKLDCFGLPPLVPIKAVISAYFPLLKEEVTDTDDMPNLTKTIKSPEKAIVSSSPEDVAMLSSILSRLVSPSLTAPPLSVQTTFFLSDVPYIDLPQTPIVSLIWVGSADFKNRLITVRDRRNEEAYEKLWLRVESTHAACKIIAKTYRGYSPMYGELCMALHRADEEWYRAVCYDEEEVNDEWENPQKVFTVFFIDLGTCDTLSRDDLMPIRKEMLFPTCVHTCKVLNSDIGVECRILRSAKIDCRLYRNKIHHMYELLII